MKRLPSVAFVDGAIDRAAHRRTDPQLFDDLLDDPRTRVLEIAGDGFVLDADDAVALRAPTRADRDASLLVFLGQGENPTGAVTAYLLVVASLGEGDKTSTAGLREVAGALGADTASLAATSLALANWHRSHAHCSTCGALTEATLGGWVRRCPLDGSEHYPRTDVAVIMAVTDAADRLLLARAPAWPPGRMSVLAGFLEPGETLAQAVAREVREEVGIEVGDITYVADQPWPFPSSLMVGFTARAQQSDLVLDEREIAEARWVTRAQIPDLIAAGEYRPSPSFSISRALVEDWYGGALPSVPDAP